MLFCKFFKWLVYPDLASRKESTALSPLVSLKESRFAKKKELDTHIKAQNLWALEEDDALFRGIVRMCVCAHTLPYSHAV
jgi:hypothetical protein